MSIINLNLVFFGIWTWSLIFFFIFEMSEDILLTRVEGTVPLEENLNLPDVIKITQFPFSFGRNGRLCNQIFPDLRCVSIFLNISPDLKSFFSIFYPFLRNYLI